MTLVTITESNPIIAITQNGFATVDVTASQQAVIVEVKEGGPQGIPGQAAQVYLVRVDAATANIIYSSRAPTGTSELSPTWLIKRRTFSSSGTLTATATATGAWSNRANLSYS